MPDWAAAGINESVLDGNTFAVTPSNTAHAKGAWSAGYTNGKRRDGAWLVFSWSQAHATARTLLIDISVDDVVIAENIAINPGGYGSVNAVRCHTQRIYLPITIPAGVVKLRSQASMAAHGAHYVVLELGTASVGEAAGPHLTALGVNAGTTRGTVVTASNTEGAFGAWAQVTDASPRMRALLLWAGHGNSWLTGLGNQWFLMQVGMGAAGAEQPLATFRDAGGSSSYTGLMHPQWAGPIFVDVPAGSRLAVRGAAEGNSSAQRNRDVIIYGA